MAQQPDPQATTHDRSRAARSGGLLKVTAREFSEDNAMMLAAATAFYAALSLAPIIVLLIWIGGLLGPDTQQRLIDWVTRSVGDRSGEAVQMVVRNAGERPGLGNVAGLISIAAALFAATGLFAQLQAAMNIIWDVRTREGGVKGWLRRRLAGLGVMLLLAVLLIASVFASTLLSGMVRSATSTLPGGDWTWWWVNLAASIIVYALLFAAIFKVLPDVHIAWGQTLFGAVVTAVLFAGGKLLIGLYFAHSTRWAAYGAAGSMVMLLVWVYYSSVIFFLGAELTQVWARRHGEPITPDENAVWADRKSAALAT